MNKLVKDNEVNLVDLTILIIDSKKTIIVITLFFSILASIYSFILNPSYKSEAIIQLGHIHQEPNIIDINDNLIFFDKIQFEQVSKNKLVLSTTSFLKKNESESSLDKAIQSILTKSNYGIDRIFQEELNLLSQDINFLESYLIFYKNEITRLLSLDKSDISSSGMENTISQLKRDLLKVEQDLVRLNYEKLSYTNEDKSSVFEHSKILKEISTKKINPPITLIILLGTFAGLFFSILYIIYDRFIIKVKS
jgi:capsular polysaccharide biosynthesis protein